MPSAGSEIGFEVIGAFLHALISEIVGIHGKASVFVREIIGQNHVDLIAGNERRMRRRDISGLSMEGRDRALKLTEGFGHSFRLVEPGAHNVRFRLIAFCQRVKTGDDGMQRVGIFKERLNISRSIVKTSVRQFKSLENRFLNLTGNLAVEIDQRIPVILQTVFGRSFQHSPLGEYTGFHERSQTIRYLFPGQRRSHHAAGHRIAGSNLHPMFIRQHGVFLPADDQPPGAVAIFLSDGVQALLVGHFHHVHGDQAQRAVPASASGAQNIVDDRIRDRGFQTQRPKHEELNLRDLLFYSRRFGQRKSRGHFDLCFRKFIAVIRLT